MLNRTIKVFESNAGWLILWPTGRTTRAKTAHAAQRAIMRSSERLSHRGHDVVNRVEWDAKTRLGRDVVETLAT